MAHIDLAALVQSAIGKKPGKAMGRPAIVIGKAEHTFVAEEGRWVALMKDGRKVTVSTHPYAFLSFLELSLTEAERLRQDACSAAGVPETECPPLPAVETIKAGLMSESQGWQALALERLEEAADAGAYEAELDRLVVHGKTQAIRHKALKLRTRLRHPRRNGA